jgi:hypothetical protein
MQVGRDVAQPLSLRACASTYLVFCLIWAVPLFLSLAATFKNPTAWIGDVICLIGLAISFIWIAFYKLELTGDVILYRTLFGGSVSLALSEIERVGITAGYNNYSDRFKAPVRLVLKSKRTSGRPSIEVNVKVFCKPDLLALLEVLNSKISTRPANDAEA